jgi:hypothetical protein
MEMLPCGTCGDLVLVSQLKYWTADQTVVFCGAKCSFEHFQRKKKVEEECKKIS